MIRLRTAGLVAATCLVAGLGFYELTAKSPALTGSTMPGWWATARAEKVVRWQPPTGLLLLDKLLHEGQEAACFYATLAGYRPRHGARQLR
ncbi:MAG: hypothetical protein IPH86_03660 [bacterium]|nr:hypothetical protein [bacterium]